MTHKINFMSSEESKKKRHSRQRTCQAYPLPVRMAAVRDYLSGMSRLEVARKYSIADMTNISHWKRKFAGVVEFKTSQGMIKRRTSRSLQTESESELSQRIKELERSLSLCQKALASKEKELKRANLHIQINETLIDLAEENFGLDIRKNFDTK